MDKEIITKQETISKKDDASNEDEKDNDMKYEYSIIDISDDDSKLEDRWIFIIILIHFISI